MKKRKFIKTCIMAGCRKSVEVDSRNGFARCEIHQKQFEHFDTKFPLVKKADVVKPKPMSRATEKIFIKKAEVEGW